MQSMPALLITLHSVFTEDNKALIAQVSIVFSIFDLCYSNTIIMLLNANYMYIRTNLHTLKRILPCLTISVLEFSTIAILWGFVSLLYRPWGAWVFVILSYALALLVFISWPNTVEFYDHPFWANTFLFGLLGRFTHGNGGEKFFVSLTFSIYDPVTVIRFVQFLGLSVSIGVVSEKCMNLLSDPFWMTYFVIGMSSAAIWIILIVIHSLSRLLKSKVNSVNEPLNAEERSRDCMICFRESQFYCKEYRCYKYFICSSCQKMLNHPHSLYESNKRINLE